MSAVDYLDLDRDCLAVGDDCLLYRYPDGVCRDLTYAPVNPHHRDFVERTFGRYLFHYLARFLFRPNHRVQAAADAVLRPVAGRFLVGIHARTWQPPYFDRRNDIGIFWNCAKRAAAEAGADDYAVVLATDNPCHREAARAVFGQRLVHTDYPTRQCGDYESAVVDQTLLTRCDALVVTDRSSFGYFAHATTLIQPYVVDGMLGTAYPQPHSQAGVHQTWPVIPYWWPWQLDRRQSRRVRDAMRPYAYRRGIRALAMAPVAQARWRFGEFLGKVRRKLCRLRARTTAGLSMKEAKDV